MVRAAVVADGHSPVVFIEPGVKIAKLIEKVTVKAKDGHIVNCLLNLYNFDTFCSTF